MKLLLLADGGVGAALFEWLLQNFRGDLGAVVTARANGIAAAARAAGVRTVVFSSDKETSALVSRCEERFDLGVLAWWPNLLRQPLLGLPAHGFINTHPSLLPYNRGKHYNFWALVEQAPFGVSLHMVDDAIDAGDIIAQRPIAYTWEDTGATLYARATRAIVDLFKETYPSLRTLQFERRAQDLRQGSFHVASELDAASVIDLDRDYRARDLLNLLRARTFAGHPACRFSDAGSDYEVTVDIRRIKP